MKELVKPFVDVYVDLDGVLADFNGHFKNLYGVLPEVYEKQNGQARMWSLVYRHPNFFETMPRTQYFYDVILTAQSMGINLVILSSPSRTNQALCMIQKRKWVDDNLHKEQSAIFDSNKHNFAWSGALLIDDTPNKVIKFREAGGNAILFRNADQLKEECGVLKEAILLKYNLEDDV